MSSNPSSDITYLQKPRLHQPRHISTSLLHTLEFCKLCVAYRLADYTFLMAVAAVAAAAAAAAQLPPRAQLEWPALQAQLHAKRAHVSPENLANRWHDVYRNVTAQSQR